MFKILQKTFETGLVTIGYPDAPARISENFRGAPRFDFANWRDPHLAAQACPTEAISIHDSSVTVDYGLCIFCGECAEADGSGAIRMSRDFELAVRNRRDLVIGSAHPVSGQGDAALEQTLRDTIHET